MSNRIHGASRWLIAVSVVVMSIAGFASNQLLVEDEFATLISKSVESAEVRKLLATKAVDVAIDASNADALLADALPDEYSLVATPALELSKPAIAEAGAQLLGIDAIESGLETAARSIHRQTAAAIVADEETDVVINTLPVLVVVSDEIAGDVGARAAVGLNLPESATSINLGSNQGVAWKIVRSLSYVAGLAVLLWLVSMVAYFVSAGRGHRLAAVRRLGITYVRTGVVLAVITWVMLVVVAVGLEIALSPGDALSFAKFSFGGLTAGGGVALAEVVFAPLLGAGRRTIGTGIVMIAATYLMGGGAVAAALRQSIRERDPAALLAAIRVELPRQVGAIKRAVTAGLAVLLILWPQSTTRVAVTLVIVALLTLVALTVLTSSRAPAPALRTFFEIDAIERTDQTERSTRSRVNRRILGVVVVIAALIWPSYERSGFVTFAVLASLAFFLTYRWELQPAEAAAEEHALIELADAGWSTRRKVAIGAIVALGIALVGFGGDTSNPASASSLAAGEPTRCNGHAELCDKRVDQVVFAGTHNSMSSSALGWELANHKGAIPAQLAGGIRALLIDVQYWPQSESIASLGLDPQAAEIAQRALAVDTAPEDGLWMCHSLCQLGGTPFSDFLADLRVFLETNPDDVLMIVIQDEAPAADIRAAIELAGIDEYAYAHEPGSAWPTLREMIIANKRLVFMAENDVGAASSEPDWYQLAFDGNVSETGFRYSVVEDFDCSESRGGNDGDFFMINHWVETGLPVPAEADRVNATSVLRNRIDECAETRGRSPSIIAVNFWERGDLLSFVDELNLSG